MSDLMSHETISTLLNQSTYRIVYFVKDDDIENKLMQRMIHVNKKKFPQVECFNVNFENITEFHSENKDKFCLNDVLVIGCQIVLNLAYEPTLQMIAHVFNQVIAMNRNSQEKFRYPVISISKKYEFLYNKREKSQETTKSEPILNILSKILEVEKNEEQLIDLKTFFKLSGENPKKILNTKAFRLPLKKDTIHDFSYLKKNNDKYKVINNNMDKYSNSHRLPNFKSNLKKNSNKSTKNLAIKGKKVSLTNLDTKLRYKKRLESFKNYKKLKNTSNDGFQLRKDPVQDTSVEGFTNILNSKYKLTTINMEKNFVKKF